MSIFLASIWPDVPPRSVATLRSHLLECACSPTTWLFRQADGSGCLCIRQDDMNHIDIQVLSSRLRQRRDAVWDDLDICPRTYPTEDLRLCTYKMWFARPAGCHARLTSRLAPFHALHAALTVLQNGLPQSVQGHWMPALCQD